MQLPQASRLVIVMRLTESLVGSGSQLCLSCRFAKLGNGALDQQHVARSICRNDEKPTRWQQRRQRTEDKMLMQPFADQIAHVGSSPDKHKFRCLLVKSAYFNKIAQTITSQPSGLTD